MHITYHHTLHALLLQRLRGRLGGITRDTTDLELLGRDGIILERLDHRSTLNTCSTEHDDDLLIRHDYQLDN